MEAKIAVKRGPLVNVFHFLRRNRFVLLLLLLFVLVDTLVARWDPMAHSPRFYKNDYVKTLEHHGWRTEGPVFFGNSAVTGAYQEAKSQSHLIEMGLSYGKITDLQAIIQKGLFHPTGELVLGIDVQTMPDKLTTDPTYPWFRKGYQPYMYQYRDYFKQVFEKTAQSTYEGIRQGDRSKLFTSAPAWDDKELYFGHNKPEQFEADLKRYDKLFNWMTLPDFAQNLAALDWVIKYCHEQGLPLKVIWMPYNPDYAKPPYMAQLKPEVQRRLDAAGVPTLDLMDAFQGSEFHDLVHLNQETGAPHFTREVDAWLLSSAKR